MNYLVPPKLQRKFLLAGLTLAELAVAIVLFLAGLFASGLLHGFVYAGFFAFGCCRFIAGKSLKDVLLVVFHYHHDAQHFTVHLPQRRKERR